MIAWNETIPILSVDEKFRQMKILIRIDSLPHALMNKICISGQKSTRQLDSRTFYTIYFIISIKN